MSEVESEPERGSRIVPGDRTKRERIVGGRRAEEENARMVRLMAAARSSGGVFWSKQIHQTGTNRKLAKYNSPKVCYYDMNQG